jgi:TPR repeat protein
MFPLPLSRIARLLTYCTAFTLFSVLAPQSSFAIPTGIDVPELQSEAERGFVPKEIELAAAYFTGHGVARDEKMAAYWYEKAAMSGDPEAENEIAFLYQTGVGVATDPARAFHWYQLAAASGYVKAKVNLGVMYVWGIGVEKNDAMAEQFFHEAVEKGYGRAATYLGDMDYFGIGMHADKTEAERWYRTGVKLHDPVAAFNLGSLYSEAKEHQRDLAKAAALLRTSATDGYVPAMHALALLVVNHPDLAHSSTEARALLETASNAGSWKSSALLGILERNGNGEPADPEAACYSFERAVLQGGDEAQKLLANDLAVLEAKLGRERTSAIAARAGDWYRQHPLLLSFIYKEDANWRRFPASASAAADDGVHAGRLIPPA